MQSGVNVAIVVNDEIARIIDSAIHPCDIAKLTDQSLRNAQRLFKDYRDGNHKPKKYKPTLREYCNFYTEHDPAYLAYRLLMLNSKR